MLGLAASSDPDGNEVDSAVGDPLEFYLLNYFKPAHSVQNETTVRGPRVFDRIGCSSCHVADLTVNHNRRVADVETAYDPEKGIFHSMFATAPLSDAHCGMIRVQYAP